MYFRTFLKTLDSVSELSGKIFIWLIIPLTIVIVFNVILRYFFYAPTLWGEDIANYLCGSYIILIAAYTLLHQGHVSVNIFYQRFAPRTRGVLSIFGHLLFYFPFCGIILYGGIEFAWQSWSIGETSAVSGLTIVPAVKMVIPVSFALLLIQGIANFFRNIMLVIRGKEI